MMSQFLRNLIRKATTPILMGVIVSSSSLLASCSDSDDDPVADYVENLGELLTGNDGVATHFRLDDGTVYEVVNNLSNLAPDSLYRVVGLYVLDNARRVRFSSLSQITSPRPVFMSSERVKEDLLDLVSAWKKPRYFNFVLRLKTGGNSHYLGFVDHGIEQRTSGQRVWHLSLYHDQNDDPLYYSREVYASCPLYHKADSLLPGRDSVYFSLQTFEGKVLLKEAY